MTGEIVFLDDAVFPDQLEQLFFVEEFTAVLDKCQQYFECLRPQRHRLAGSSQRAADHIEHEGPEGIHTISALILDLHLSGLSVGEGSL